MLVRKTEPKPIRIFLQDGRNDLNNYTGDWFVANQDMLSALDLRRLRRRTTSGATASTTRGTRPRSFPTSLRWLWRDYPAPIVANAAGASKQDVYQMLLPGRGLAARERRPPVHRGPAANDKGEVFFVDVRASRIHKVGLDGKVSVFAENTRRRQRPRVRPGRPALRRGRRKKQIVAYDAAGTAEVLAENVSSNDLAINAKGDIYFTDFGGKKVWYLPKGGAARSRSTRASSGRTGFCSRPIRRCSTSPIRWGSCRGRSRSRPDGSLAHKQRYFYVHHERRRDSSNADGMKVDTEGRVYIATPLGIQVFDQIGKCHAIIPAPSARAALEPRRSAARTSSHLRHQPRQGVQAQGEDQGRPVVEGADQAGRAAAVGRGRVGESLRAGPGVPTSA